jgi:hypothetical protein
VAPLQGRQSGPMPRLICLALSLVTIGWLAATAAPASSPETVCRVSSAVANARPDPDGVPTQVRVGLYVIDITSINDRDLSFTADAFLRLQWNDPRLAAGTEGTSLANCKPRIDDVWNPRVQIVNRRQLSKQVEDVVEVDPEGTVTYRQRFYGEFSSKLDLADFPFDKQVLWMRVGSLYSPEEVLYVNDENLTGRVDTFSIPDWFVGPVAARVSSQYFSPQERSLARIDFSFESTRDSGFYVWRVIVPLALIVFMSWTVFWIDPSHLGAQLSVSTASVLTLIAFQFALSSLLPRISYLTRMDQFLLGSTGLIFLALGESVFTSTLAQRTDSALPRKIDQWSRWIFAALFVGIVFFTLL